MKKTITSVIFSFFLLFTQAQDVDLSHLPGSWKASWISCPDINQRAYGVYHFRKIIKLASKPGNYIVHVSADNRYRLFVNGKAVCAGPARGDLYNWNFETIDLAPYLEAGDNIIAALVWNMGEYAAVAQVSNQTGFLLQSYNDQNTAINTNASWKVYADAAYHPCSTDNGSRLRTYMVIGPGDSVNAAAFPWNWETLHYDDSKWQSAREVMGAVMVGYGSDNLWSLSPRTIPLMQETLQRIPVIRRSSEPVVDTSFLKGTSSLEVPAHKKISILLDQQYNTVSYPELLVSNGKGAQIKMTYAEALFDKSMNKGNRNEIEGKQILGNFDVFIADGGARLFRPLWQRTYRYLQLDIETKDAALSIDGLQGVANGYPFKENASFECSDPSLKDIWNVGWRTAKLCAGETYFDCPYYEQLQYEADTRIQVLISLYVSGDDRLMRKAIHDFYLSRVPEGLTQGRYPSSRMQVIPTFSLYWISMLHDYWMYRNDTAFVKQYLSAVRGGLDWYEDKIDKSKNMLGPMRWWNFEDWNLAFPGGVPDGANDGNSSLVTLHYVYTLQQAAGLFAFFGKANEAAQYASLANKLADATYKLCFDTKRNVMANTPEKKSFSQHASIMGVLCGAIPATRQKAVMQKVLSDTSLSQATFFYRFYLNQALKKAGMGDAYYSQLTPWRHMLDMGLTTFAENPDPTRSDCHAWSASPNYDFLATICGIEPAAYGFTKVKIEPHLGELQWASGVLPHPKGNLAISLKRQGTNSINATIDLPQGVTGDFIWNGKNVKLKEGKNAIVL